MSESTKLPPLPISGLPRFGTIYYNPEQMQAYARAAVALNAPVWLPIETAPKDGTEILCWRNDCGHFIGSYTSPDGFPLTQAELDALDDDTLCKADWFTQWPDARRLEGCEVPTHWQPLPAGPEAA